MDETFDPRDFQRMRLKVTFTNSTTRTAIDEGSEAVEITEFDEKKIVLEVPEKACALNHQILITIERVLPSGSEQILSATCRVATCEKDGSGRQKIALILVQFEEKAWQYLLSLYASRQDEIERFLAAAKGT